MDREKLKSFIKETARDRNLRTIEYIIRESFLLEEKELKGGESANLRGETSEVALHNSIKNYISHKNDMMNQGHSENKAHNLALDYLKSDEHAKKLNNQTKKYESKKIQTHANNYADDFSHTVKDTAHAAAHYIDHIVRKHGHLTDAEPMLTGPEGEIKTAQKVGITNADILIRAKGKKKVFKKIKTRQGENRIPVNILVPRVKGNSLKYEDKKTATTKIRTPGDEAFHSAITKLSKSVFGDNHEHTNELDRLRNQQIESSKRSKQNWTNHHQYGEINDFMKTHGYKESDSISKVQSNLRKISRNNEDNKHIQDKALEHLHTMKNVEQGSQNSRISYMNHVSKVLNSAYQSSDDNAKRAVNQFHREISGVFHRKRKWSKLKTKSGEEIKAKVIPTVMMKISRSKRQNGTYVPPNTKILSLRDRFERVSKQPGNFHAIPTEGGGLTIGKGNKGFLRMSLDSSGGKMISYLQSNMKKK